MPLYNVVGKLLLCTAGNGGNDPAASIPPGVTWQAACDPHRQVSPLTQLKPEKSPLPAPKRFPIVASCDTFGRDLYLYFHELLICHLQV
jgi:hypothetical protein